MFTGMIEELGTVKRVEKSAGRYRFEVEAKSLADGVKIGDSVSVNGVCLTAVKKDKDILAFDVMEETARRTTLVALSEGARVNLEQALKATGRMGGHFVLGHIDCVGAIKEIEKRGDNVSIAIESPAEFKHLAVEKGSIAIDGVSLTIGGLKEGGFKVYLIPHTLDVTTLGLKKRGDGVNLEFDIIGKYVAALAAPGNPGRITEGFLKEKGFIQ